MSEPSKQFPRFLQVFMGALLGLIWGSFLWGVTGRDTGLRGWVYIAMTCAMLGCGVAAFFGARIVRRQGERVTPRMSRFRRRG